MKIITVGAGQQIEDMGLLAYGDALAGAVLLSEDNGLSFEELLYPGQVLKLRDEVPDLSENNRLFKQKLIRDGIDPVTGISGDRPDELYVEEDYVDDDYMD